MTNPNPPNAYYYRVQEPLVLMIYILQYLKDPKLMGLMGIFLTMGNAKAYIIDRRDPI